MSHYDPTMNQPVSKRRKLLPVLAGAATLLLGIGLGAAVGGGGSTLEPVVRETPGPTVTETRNVDRVPQVCLDALDHADAAFSGFSAWGEAMQKSIISGDYSEPERIMAGLNSQKYVTAKEACRAAAQ
jgi:hypothetical protein